MLSSRSIMDLQAIARTGGNLDFNARGYATMDLQALARTASSSGAKLVLRGLDGRATMDLQAIARAGDGCVTFAD